MRSSIGRTTTAIATVLCAQTLLATGISAANAFTIDGRRIERVLLPTDA